MELISFLAFFTLKYHNFNVFDEFNIFCAKDIFFHVMNKLMMICVFGGVDDCINKFIIYIEDSFVARGFYCLDMKFPFIGD